jgi:hypothetical protein
MSFLAISLDKLAAVTGGFDFSPIIKAKSNQLQQAAQRQKLSLQAMSPLPSSSSSSSSSGADGAQKKW